MARRLETTNWTLILNAEATDPEVRRLAMTQLCEAYWYPLYAFARRRGSSHDDAADLTQAFFLHLIEKHALRGLDRALVRFRAYLLASFKNFEADRRDRAMALKRGGDRIRVTFDPAVLERRYTSLNREEDPERLYERQWALTLLERARERLRLSYDDAGKTREFEVLGPHLTSGRGAVSATALAAALGSTEGAARIALYRLRRQFGSALRAEVGATVGDADQVESELRFLLTVLAGAEGERAEADRAL